MVNIDTIASRSFYSSGSSKKSNKSTQSSSGLIGGDAGLRAALTKAISKVASKSISSKSSSNSVVKPSSLNIETRKSGHGGGSGSSLTRTSIKDKKIRAITSQYFVNRERAAEEVRETITRYAEEKLSEYDSPTAREAAKKIGGEAIEAEKSLERKSTLYNVGEAITYTGEKVGRAIKKVLPLERVPGGEIVEGVISETVKAPFVGIGSFVQALAFHESVIKGKKLTETEKKVLGETAKKVDVLLMASLAAEAGIRVAERGIRRVVDAVLFRNKKFIPIEKLTQPEVVSGEVRFPLPKDVDTGKVVTGRGDIIVKQFYKSRSIRQTELGRTSKVSGFHATSVARGPKGIGKGFKTHDVVKRPKDLPGLYIAPDVSPHFLRVAEGESYSLIPRPRNPLKRPGILQVAVEEVRRLPKSVLDDVKKAQEFMRTQAEKAKAYVSWEAEHGNPEAEAEITPGTIVENIRGKSILGGKFEYYTEWKGRKIPIYEMKAIGDDAFEEINKATGNLVKTIRERLSLGEAVRRYEIREESKWIPSEGLKRAAAAEILREKIRRIKEDFAAVEKAVTSVNKEVERIIWREDRSLSFPDYLGSSSSPKIPEPSIPTPPTPAPPFPPPSLVLPPTFSPPHTPPSPPPPSPPTVTPPRMPFSEILPPSPSRPFTPSAAIPPVAPPKIPSIPEGVPEPIIPEFGWLERWVIENPAVNILELFFGDLVGNSSNKTSRKTRRRRKK